MEGRKIIKTSAQIQSFGRNFSFRDHLLVVWTAMFFLIMSSFQVAEEARHRPVDSEAEIGAAPRPSFVSASWPSGSSF